jgi:septum site-determining protein MinC
VHAGADGDQTAVVCALDLAPNRLRIAEIIAITPVDQAEPIPEVARILNGQIIAEPWQNP